MKTFLINGGHLTIILCLIFAMFFISTVGRSAGSVMRVKPAGLASGVCANWGNACNLQYALTLAVTGDDLWLAEGFYRPTTTNDRTATFQLKSGVALYGGFYGNELDRSYRNPALHATILSGDIGASGDESDNSYHVVTAKHVDSTAILDGLTIMDGNADTGDYPNGRGGGIFIEFGGPTLQNFVIRSNSANKGGGLYTSQGLNFQGRPILTNGIIQSNLANNSGGGMYNDTSEPLLTNVTIWANLASSSGGGIYNTFSNPVLTNVTMYENHATDFGGGIYNHYTSNPLLRNSILWANQAFSDSQISDLFGNTPTIQDSIVQGGCPAGATCTHLITDDPRLEHAAKFGGQFDIMPPMKGSPAIDAGAGAPVCPPADARGVPRPQGQGCDIGAVEVQNHLLVKPGGLTGGGCLDWPHACELGYALDSAFSGQDVWVAAGTYLPSVGLGRSASFTIISEIELYGGFIGNETARNQRDPITNITVLSGDLGVPGDISDNSYHVVSMLGIGCAGVLDGFTITLGNANGNGLFENQGGGLLNAGCRLTVQNVTFTGNSAVMGGGMHNHSGSPPVLTHVVFDSNSAIKGGGMDNFQSRPVLSDVTFEDNIANDAGGGMYNADHNVISLDHVIFKGNHANDGAGMANAGSSEIDVGLGGAIFNSNIAAYRGGGIFNLNEISLSLTNMSFRSNSAEYGGGIANHNSNATIENMTLISNTAYAGGGVFNVTSSPTINNLTLVGNSAVKYGGGVYNDADSHPRLHNSILWGNQAWGGAQIFNDASTISLQDSLVQGGCPAGATCTNVISANPRLGALGNYGGASQTLPLLPGSPAIDGVPGSSPCPAADQRGVARPVRASCDIGAFESRGFTFYNASGSGQVTQVNTAFPLPLSLHVRGVGNEPVDGGQVTFSAPDSGASANPRVLRAIIDGGVVVQPVTANGIPGFFHVTATTRGASPFKFDLHNLVDWPLYVPLVIKR